MEKTKVVQEKKVSKKETGSIQVSVYISKEEHEILTKACNELSENVGFDIPFGKFIIKKALDNVKGKK